MAEIIGLVILLVMLGLLWMFFTGVARHEEQLRERREYDIRRLRGDG